MCNCDTIHCNTNTSTQELNVADGRIIVACELKVWGDGDGDGGGGDGDGDGGGGDGDDDDDYEIK